MDKRSSLLLKSVTYGRKKFYNNGHQLFVEAVWNMKKLSQRDVADECRRIWQQFFATGADMLVRTQVFPQTDQGIPKGGSITVQLTSCLTGLD